VPHLLHIDSSASTRTSTSRRLTAQFVSQWQSAHPEGVVTYRDLAAHPLPHVDEATVDAIFTPPQYRTDTHRQNIALSEELITELEAADTIVLGVPMYNLNIPSTLKAWIDRVVIFGRTFDGVSPGLFAGRRLIVITARGGAYGPGTPRELCDFQEPYLRTILGFVGLTDIAFVHAEMRLAEVDPALAEFKQFALDSYSAAEASISALIGEGSAASPILSS
jgi:FMN-dependent NADH-azoreductase